MTCSPDAGSTSMQDSFIASGIKMDHGAAGLIVKRTQVEHTERALVTVDPSTTGWGYPNPSQTYLQFCNHRSSVR